MKRAGIALFFVVVAALAFAVLQPDRVYVVRQRFYGRGLAWSARNCEIDADCVAVGCWITSKKNPGMSQLLRAANEVKDVCSTAVQCSDSVCVARQ